MFQNIAIESIFPTHKLADKKSLVFFCCCCALTTSKATYRFSMLVPLLEIKGVREERKRGKGVFYSCFNPYTCGV